MTDNEVSEHFNNIIAKTWVDEAFKQRLLSEPMATLTAEGIDIPPQIEVRVVENTDSIFYLVLQAKPTDQWKRAKLWMEWFSKETKSP